MKIGKLLVGLGLCGLTVLLSSCVGFGTKFDTPSDEALVLGKMTPVESLKQFGQPYGKSTKSTKNGDYLTYTYDFAVNRFGTISSRVLLLEFKENTLNGYYWWSSFKEDKTTVNQDCFGKLQAGIGKLTKADVLALAGKPNGKAHCPTLISDFKEACEKNSEVWGWYMREQVDVTGERTPKSLELTITFDADGKVSTVETTEYNSLQKTRI